MAKGFNLTAQINLRGPNNLKPIVADIKRELGTIQANVSVKLDNRSAKSVDDITRRLSAMNSVLIQSKQHANDLKNTFRDLSAALGNFQSTNQSASRTVQQVAQNFQSTSKNIQVARTEMEEFGRQTFLAVKRFAAFSLPTTGIFAFVNAINNAINSFINFDKELIKLQQVTGKGAVGISGLEQEITRLSTSLGVSSESLLTVASTLAQAGLSAEETRIALAALAKTELAPSFDDIKSTTEGAIAALRQFGLGVGDLEAALGSINAVAAAFAVESSDIIAAIQRTGGVFASASKGVSQGKDALNEFIAVFTSVRATTRESAETIATGLRTIFTRIQRADTIKQLKEFGVNLQDLEGKFVGPFEAVKRLSAALNQLDPRDIKFSTIVEELGGFRQIGKVIPLIQQFATAQQALGVAQKGAGSLTEAQIKAQESLANQITKVREQFLALIRDIGKSSVFQGLFKIVTGLTSGLISLAGAFKPILPLLGIFAAVKGVKAISEIGSGFFGGMRKGGGAKAVGTNIGETLSGAKEKEASDVKNRATTAITENTTALKTLTTAVNALTSAMGSRPPGTLSEGGRILRFQTGGVVPGSGRGDKVHAMLEPGEVVLNNQVGNKYGRSKLNELNKYASGGQTLGDRVSASGQELSNIYPSLSSKVIKTKKYSTLVKPNPINPDSIKVIGHMIKNKRLNKTLSMWRNFELSLSKAYGIEGSEQKNDYLDFPNVPGEAKFLKAGENNRMSDGSPGLKGNNNLTMLGKLIGANKYEKKYIEAYYPTNPKQIAGIVNDYTIGKQQNKTKYSNFKLAVGGLVQKFMAGSVGGAKKKGIDWESLNKGRGSKESRGARPIVEPISTETYLKWAKGIYDEYDADPSLVRTASGLPPEIDLANKLLAQYAFETGGAGLKVGQRFVRTPKNQITDDLKPHLIPDPSDPSESGFYEDIVAKFLRPKRMSKVVTSKLGKDYALKAATARLSSYADAESAISEFKKSGILNIDPDIMSYITGSISDPTSLPLPKNEITSIQSKLTPTNLEAFQALIGKDKIPVSVQGQRTKLSEVFGAILATYGSDTSDLEVDNIIRGLGQSISKKEAKKLSFGGLIQKFMAGSVGGVNPSDLLAGPFPVKTKRNDGMTWREILSAKAAELGLVVDNDSATIGDKRIPLKNIFSDRQLRSEKMKKKIGQSGVDKLDSYTQKIVQEYTKGRSEVAEANLFNLTEEEKARARSVAIVGLQTDFASSARQYFKRVDGLPLSVHMGALSPEKFGPILEQMRERDFANIKDISQQLLPNEQLAELSRQDREVLGMGNAEGYDLETILALLGAKGGVSVARSRAVDFAGGLPSHLAELFGVPPNIFTQAKRTINSDSVSDALAGIVAKIGGQRFAFGGKADGPGFEEIRQQILDKYPEIDFRITKRKKKYGFGYNLMGALKAKGGRSPGSGQNFDTAPNLKQLVELSDQLAQKLMSPEGLAGGGLLSSFASGGTVPALVSNGEAFIPPAQAKKIGYAKLNKMNQADRNGMTGFAEGGISKFKGPGSGTSDSIGPVNLPVGSYVIREKATKALGLSRGGGVGIKKFAKGTAVTKIESLKAEVGSERAKKTQLEQQRASVTGIDAEILQNAIDQSAEKIRKLEASIENAISGFDESTQDMENKDKALSDATQQLINKVKEKYEKTSGKKWEDLTAGKQAAIIKKARAGGYKGKAGAAPGVDPFEMENKTVDKAEKAAKRRRARRQKGYGDLKSTADIREATLTPQEVKQQKEADKEMFKYRADQAGTSEASVKLDLARKLGRATYESQSLFGGKVSEARTGLVTRRESSMKIKQTIDKARSQFEEAKDPAAKAAAATQLADAQSRLAAESEAVLQQMIELRPDLAGTEEGMKKLKDASTEVADQLSEGNLGEAQKKLQAAVAGSGAAGALSDTEAAAIARARVSRETGFSSELLERQFGSGKPDAAMARRQVFAQSREGQRFGSLAEFVPGLEGFSKTRIGKGLGGAADFISGKGGMASQLFARAGGIQGIGAGVAVGTEAIKQFVMPEGTKDPNVAGAFGAISGAGAMGAGGAQLGMMIAGPVGALIGGIGGAIIGGIKGFWDAQNATILQNSLDALAESSGNVDKAFQVLDAQFNQANFKEAEIAIGKQIESQASVEKIAMTGPSFLGPNAEQRKEAAAASSAAAISTTKNLTRLVESNLSKTSLADLQKTRINLEAGRGENPILAQAKSIAKMQGLNEAEAARTASINAAVAQLKESGVQEEQITRLKKESSDELAKTGEKLLNTQALLIARQQEVNRIMHEVAKATESMMDALASLQGRIQRFGDGINDILTESENIANPNEIRRVKRTSGERILSNTAGYSRDEVQGAIDSVVQRMGGGTEAVSLGKQVSAGEDLRKVLPALLRQPGASTDTTKITDAATSILQRSGLDRNDPLISSIISELGKKLEGAKGEGGQGLGLLADEIEKVGLGGFSKVLDSAKESLIDFDRKVNDAFDALTKVQNQWVDAMMRSIDYSNRATQVGLQGALELQKALGQSVSLEEMNKPFETEVRGLTGGTLDPVAINRGITESREKLRQLENERASLVIQPESESRTNGLVANDESTRKYKLSIDKADKALKMLAENGSTAANALQKLSENQGRAKAFSNTLSDIVFDSQKRMDVAPKLAAFVTGQKALQQGDNRLFGNEVFGKQYLGGIDLLGQLGVKDEKLTQLRNQATIEGLKAQGQGALLQEVIPGAEKLFGQGNDTIEEILNLASNPENDPLVQAVEDAYLAQQGALNALSDSAADIASNLRSSGIDPIINELSTALPNLIKKAYDEAKANIAAATKEAAGAATTTETPSAPRQSLVQRYAGNYTTQPTPREQRARERGRASGYKSGGLIYASEGQYVNFEPKGTDTVPAMLTEGEFVVNREATAKNLSLLKAINSGQEMSDTITASKGGVVYAATGGMLRDTGPYKAQQQQRASAYKAQQEARRQQYLARNPAAAKLEERKKQSKIDEAQKAYNYWLSKGKTKEEIDRMIETEGSEDIKRRALKEYRLFRQRKFTHGIEVANKLENAQSKEEKDKILAEAGVKTEERRATNQQKRTEKADNSRNDRKIELLREYGADMDPPPGSTNTRLYRRRDAEAELALSDEERDLLAEARADQIGRVSEQQISLKREEQKRRDAEFQAAQNQQDQKSKQDFEKEWTTKQAAKAAEKATTEERYRKDKEERDTADTARVNAIWAAQDETRKRGAVERKANEEQKKKDEEAMMEAMARNRSQGVLIDPITKKLLNYDPDSMRKELEEWEASNPLLVKGGSENRDKRIKELKTDLRAIDIARQNFTDKRAQEIADTQSEYEELDKLNSINSFKGARQAQRYARLAMIRGKNARDISGGRNIEAERELRDESLGADVRQKLEGAESKKFREELKKERQTSFFDKVAAEIASNAGRATTEATGSETLGNVVGVATSVGAGLLDPTNFASAPGLSAAAGLAIDVAAPVVAAGIGAAAGDLDLQNTALTQAATTVAVGTAFRAGARGMSELSNPQPLKPIGPTVSVPQPATNSSVPIPQPKPAVTPITLKPEAVTPSPQPKPVTVTPIPKPEVSANTPTMTELSPKDRLINQLTNRQASIYEILAVEPGTPLTSEQINRFKIQSSKLIHPDINPGIDPALQSQLNRVLDLASNPTALEKYQKGLHRGYSHDDLMASWTGSDKFSPTILNKRRPDLTPQGAKTAQTKASGGIVYAANGGFLARGTDTIPAMLSKGEFVVNSDATSNNLPLLQHLNKGGMVRYYQQGSTGPVPSNGPVSSNNSSSSAAYKVDSSGLDSFLTNFGSYVDKLTKITFPTIPDTITMNGNHVVDVRVSGAAAFEAINENVKNMINTAIDAKMGELWRQSNGQLGSRPVSAGGSKSTGAIMQ
jgi:hypothetical protein